MSTPVFRNKGSSYFFTWKDEQLQTEVSRVRQHRDGRVTCRIIWTTTKLGYAPHIWQKDGFNLSACNNPLNRKELAGRYKEKVEWTEILEQVSVQSIAEFERGEPMLELYGGDNAVKPLYILRPFLVDKFPSILFGDPSSGKTTFALLLALTVTLPWEDNPLNLQAPSRPHHVGYLDWETGQQGIEWQWQTVQLGAGTGGVPLWYRRCHAPLSDDIDTIREYITENDISVIIIDSLALAAGGELKDTSSPLAFFRALGQLNVTSLSLAHTPKEKENRTIYGNRFFEAEARNTWEIIKQQEAGSAEMTIGLKHRKPLPWDKVMPDMAFNLCFSENGAGTIFKPSDPKSIDEFMERLSLESRMLSLLKMDGRPRTPTEFAKELGKTTNDIRQVLFRAMRKAKPGFVKLEHDKYGLADYRLSGFEPEE